LRPFTPPNISSRSLIVADPEAREALRLLRWGAEHIGGDTERSRNWNHRHWQDAAVAFLAATPAPDTGAEERLRAALDAHHDRRHDEGDNTHCAADCASEITSESEVPREGLDWHQIADDIEGAAFRVIVGHDVLARTLHREIAAIRDASLSGGSVDEGAGS
jgi:hypothetical protein